MTKIQMSLEWLASKSEAEQRLLLSDDGYEFSGWQHGYPSVNAEEAEALRAGKPYPMSQFDLQRMEAATMWGCDGNPDSDPFIIKGLAKGLLTQNPAYERALLDLHAWKTSMIAQYGPGDYSHYGFSEHRWVATDAGKEFWRGLDLE